MRSLFVLLIPCMMSAQAPDWVTGMGGGATYPSSTYLTGFGIAQLKAGKPRNEVLEEAVNGALRNAAEKVRVSILGTVELRTEERDTSLSQYFSTVTQSRTTLELEGLDSKTYLDDKAGLLYALVFARRDQLFDRYNRTAGLLRARLAVLLKSGRAAAAANDLANALTSYLQVLPLFRQIEELEGILMVLRESSPGQMEKTSASARHDAELTASVEQEMVRLLQRPVRTLDDAATLLTHILAGQLGEKHLTMGIEPPSFQDTRSGSPFSRYLHESLLSSAASIPSWEVHAAEAPLRVRGVQEGDRILVRGTYWDVAGGVRVRIIARKAPGGTIVGSASVTIAEAIVDASGLATTPANFSEVAHDLRKIEHETAPHGGLQLELWTNKGEENPVFVRGERMRVFVRANMPCVVRLIYHLADGQRTLLLDEYRITAGAVRNAIRVPGEFECDAPYGAEILQAFASTTTLPRLAVEQRGGYAYITGTLDALLRTSRAQSTPGSGSLTAEARVVVTTMPE